MNNTIGTQLLGSENSSYYTIYIDPSLPEYTNLCSRLTEISSSTTTTTKTPLLSPSPILIDSISIDTTHIITSEFLANHAFSFVKREFNRTKLINNNNNSKNTSSTTKRRREANKSKNIWILKEQWIRDCVERGQWLDESNQEYLLNENGVNESSNCDISEDYDDDETDIEATSSESDSDTQDQISTTTSNSQQRKRKAVSQALPPVDQKRRRLSSPDESNDVSTKQDIYIIHVQCLISLMQQYLREKRLQKLQSKSVTVSASDFLYRSKTNYCSFHSTQFRMMVKEALVNSKRLRDVKACNNKNVFNWLSNDTVQTWLKSRYCSNDNLANDTTYRITVSKLLSFEKKRLKADNVEKEDGANCLLSIALNRGKPKRGAEPNLSTEQEQPLSDKQLEHQQQKQLQPQPQQQEKNATTTDFDSQMTQFDCDQPASTEQAGGVVVEEEAEEETNKDSQSYPSQLSLSSMFSMIKRDILFHYQSRSQSFIFNNHVYTQPDIVSYLSQLFDQHHSTTS